MCHNSENYTSVQMLQTTKQDDNDTQHNGKWVQKVQYAC